MKQHRLASFVLALILVLLAAFPAAAQGLPRIPRPAPVLPSMQTDDFIQAFLEWRNADTSECHSQPFEFAEALFDLKGVFKNEYGNGTTAKIVRNPGPVAGIMVADFTSGKMPTLVSTGESLYRDKQDKLVWLWTNEDAGIFSVHAPIKMPPGAEWIMFPLQGDVLNHAVDFASFWGMTDEQNCADGAVRTLERQGYVPEAEVTEAVTETVAPSAGQPMTLDEFEAVVADLTGDAWLNAANAAAEANDAEYRVDVVGEYTLPDGHCLVYWGSPVELPGAIDMANTPADAGWAGLIICAEGADVVLTFPVAHSGVLLAAE